MSDSIDRQAAIDALRHMCSEDKNGVTVSRANVNSMLRALPPVTPQPKPARWIPIDEEPHEDYECSNCEYIISMYIDMAPHLEYKYCPNCGRKMEGTVYER